MGGCRNLYAVHVLCTVITYLPNPRKETPVTTQPRFFHRRSDSNEETRRLTGRAWTLLAVSLGTFMTYLDNNIINVAIPTIQRDLNLSQSGIEWVVSAYLLLFAGLLLASGRLADVFGRRRLFIVGLAIFTVASLAAGLSGRVDVLIASRAVQGFGAALLTPPTLAIITTSFPDPRERAGAVGAWSAVGALALAVGPLLGGILSEDANWHWIFFINVPVGIVTLALASRVIPADGPGRAHGIDQGGILTSIISLTSLTYALIQGPQTGWGNALVLGAFALSIAAAVAFVIIERRVDHPMVDLSIFTDRIFFGGTAALMMWAFGLFGIYFFTSLYLQNVLGFSPIKAGLTFLPMAILIAGSAAVSDRVAARVGAYRSVGFAMALMAGGIISISLLGANVTFLDLMPGLAIIGIGGGLTIPLTTTILGVQPETRAGIASALFNASREIAGLFGITVIGVVLASREHAATRAGSPVVTSFLDGYHLGLLVAGALVAAGGLVAWLALRETVPLNARVVDTQ